SIGRGFDQSVTAETTMTRCSNHLTSRVAILAIAVFLAGSSGSAPANADPAVSPNSEDTAKKEEFVKRLFAGAVAKQKSYVCFVRQYDPEHLARHPLQKVSVMKLLLTAETVPESDGPAGLGAVLTSRAEAAPVVPDRAKVVYHLSDLDKVNFVLGNIK